MSRDTVKKAVFIFSFCLLIGGAAWRVLADGAAIPPADIVDLTAVNVGSSSAQLTWSAPGADGYVEPATTYDMRFSTATFNATLWSTLTRMVSTPTPGQPATQESFTLTGLSPSTTYYVAVRGVDSFGTLSQAFNIISFTTASSGPSTVTNVTFSLRLEGIAIPTLRSITITFFTAGTLNSAGTFTATTDSSGRVTLPGTVAIPGGRYDILVSSSGYLRAKLFEYNMSSNATVTLPLLKAGDLNSDNIVNALDWSLMSVRWFSNDATADINKDGMVNSLDWSLLSRNWFQTGQ